MPLPPKLQLIKLHYKAFLKKLAAAHSDRGDVLVAIGETGPGGTAAALRSAHYIIADELGQRRVRVEASFEQSFARVLSLATIINLNELRASYHASKQRAKEQIRQALDAKLAYLGAARPSDGVSASPTPAGTSAPQASERAASSTGASTSKLSSDDFDRLFGKDGALRRAVLYLVGNASRAYMTALNTTTVHGGLQVLADAVLRRPPGQPLITVSNHVAALDDPLVVAALLPGEALQQPDKLRWTLCATDRCFRYAALSPFFTAAKVLPVVRGGGLSQAGMAAAESRLAAGDWVHIFPEGTRSPDGTSLGAARKGVGRLVAAVAEAQAQQHQQQQDEGAQGAAAAEGVGSGRALPPLLVPFVHRGMERIMPRGKVLPATGQKVDVLVGDPIPVDDLLAAARDQHWPADTLHTAVAARVSAHLRDLARRLDATRDGAPDPGPDPRVNDVGVGLAGGVSSLDQFDLQDLALAAALKAKRQGAVAAAWERVKFRMQHREGTGLGWDRVWGYGAAAGAGAGSLQGMDAGAVAAVVVGAGSAAAGGAGTGVGAAAVGGGDVISSLGAELRAAAGHVGSSGSSWGESTSRHVRQLVGMMYGTAPASGAAASSVAAGGGSSGAAVSASIGSLGATGSSSAAAAAGSGREGGVLRQLLPALASDLAAGMGLGPSGIAALAAGARAHYTRQQQQQQLSRPELALGAQ